MTCRHCGTEIADKALVCYRCGHATAEPDVRPGRVRTTGGRLPLAAALVVLMLAALFMAQAARGEAPAIVSWAVAGLAAVVLAWRLARRRRR